MTPLQLLLADAAPRKPELVSSSFKSTTAGASTIVFDTPANISPGNLLVAMMASTTTGDTWTAPAGWGLETSFLATPGNVGWACFTRIADGTEGATVTFTCSASRTQDGFIVNLKNATMGYFGAAAASSGSTVTAPAVTTAQNDSLLFAAYFSRNSATTPSTPSGMTVVGVDADSSFPSCGLFVEERPTAGPTGTRASTVNGAAGVLFWVAPPYSPPAITLVGATQQQNSTSGTTLALALPSGVADGDLMIAQYSGNRGTWTVPADWNEIVDQGTGAGLGIAWKIASGESGPYTFTISIGSTLGGSLVAFRGAMLDTVGAVASGADPLVSTALPAAKGARALLVAVRSIDSLTIVPPAGFTSIDFNNDSMSPSWRVAWSDDWLWNGESAYTSVSFGSITNVAAVLITVKPA